MARTKKRSSGTGVAQVALHQVGLSLQDLPEKPKETWSLREAVELLQEPISTALSRGYSYEEIVGILGKHDIRITASSLKRYLAVAKRGKEDVKEQPKTQRKPRRKKEEAVQPEAEQEQPVAAEVKTPTRKRRRSAAESTAEETQVKTAAKAKPTTRTRTASRATASRTRKKG